MALYVIARIEDAPVHWPSAWLLVRGARGEPADPGRLGGARRAARVHLVEPPGSFGGPFAAPGPAVAVLAAFIAGFAAVAALVLGRRDIT